MNNWNIPDFELTWPIEHDGKTIDTLTLRPITHGDHVRVIDQYSDDNDRMVGLLTAASGLDEIVLDQLKRPDYNSLAAIIGDLVTQDAEHFMDSERAATRDVDAPELLHPIEIGNGQRIESLSLEMPTLKASRLMEKYKTARERAEFITAHCTGLMLPDVALLSVPDWNSLQGRINDFLNAPAASFQRTI